MRLPFAARLLGQTDDHFKMETTSDFCSFCGKVEKAKIVRSPLPGGVVEGVERELHKSRQPFPAQHFAVNHGLTAALKHLKELQTA